MYDNKYAIENGSSMISCMIITMLIRWAIGGWGGQSNREIVSFRSCVRAGEARRSCVGEREAIRLCS